MADDLLGQARRLSGVLSSRGIPHAFIGGLAMNAWSIPVPTYDIDICADLDPEHVPDLIAELDRAGFVPPATPWLESRAADVFLATDAFQKSALARRRRVELEEGFHADVIAPEDLLLYKLVAYRNKDRAAIERLLAIQSALEWGHVRMWARRMGVTSRLEEALREAGLDPTRG
jgi:hypothetical protein